MDACRAVVLRDVLLSAIKRCLQFGCVRTIYGELFRRLFREPADFPGQLTILKVLHHLDQIHLVVSPSHPTHKGISIQHLRLCCARLCVFDDLIAMLRKSV
jgi:hypothetical protein